MRVAVSGINGFVGVHLARELVGQGHEVFGMSKGPLAVDLNTLVADYADTDLAQQWPTGPWDAVVHLAGLSAVGPSFDDPQGYIEANSAPVTRLFEGLMSRGAAPRVVVVSTGAVYAPGVGLTEASPTRAASPYAVSKLLVEAQCAYYRQRGCDVTVMRPFNHIGPGQQPGFLLPDLIAGLSGLDGGRLKAGNLDTRRDYTDVRDVARAYRLAVEADRIDVPLLNVCSATSVPGRRLLELVADELGQTISEVDVVSQRIRPEDPLEISGDNSLITQVLGWQPAIDLGTTVHDTVAAATAVA